MSSITSRQFSELDKEELNDSYNRFTHRSRTLEQFEWEWLKTPEGWGSMWLLIENDSGKIIGNHGLIPIKFSSFGKDTLAGKTENTFMHQPYAAKGIYYPFEAIFVEEAKDKFDLLYTTQGSGAPGRIRLKLGYSIVGGYENYVKAISKPFLDKMLAGAIEKIIHSKFLAFLLTMLSKFAGLAIMPVFSRRGSIDETIKLEKVTKIGTIAEELDMFWEHNKGRFGITVDRNSRYLQWRIFDNPNLEYEFFKAEKNGYMVGYVITKSRDEAGSKRVTIVDIIADGNDEILFNSILYLTVNKCKERGTHVINFPTLLSDNFLNRALKKNGFVPYSILRKVIPKDSRQKTPESFLMAKVLSAEIDPARVYDPACWYYTEMLTEGIR